MMTFYLFDRWGKQLGTIENVSSAVHVDELNGEDSLTIEFEGEGVIKGYRVVWRDKFGFWHEHIVADFTVHHADGRVYTSAYCENSISELLTDYVVWKRPSGNTATLLMTALQDSRWVPGTVTASGAYDANWYHVSAYEAVTDIVQSVGGELSTTVMVDGSEVTERRVNVLARRGGDYGRLFVYGRNLTNVQRTIEPGEVYTALYGYGKGLPVYDDDGHETGGFSNKLTFGAVNGGRDWVGDEQARLVWGVPDGKGGIKHAFGKVEFDDCEDAAELLVLTKLALERMKQPQVSYTGDVVSLARAGFTNGEDVQTGDTIYIRDKELGERLSGRILRVERDLLEEANTVITLGCLSTRFTDTVKEQQANLDWLKNQSAAWTDSAQANLDWLNHLFKSLNDQFDAVNNYHVQSFTVGDIWATVPMDDDGKPLRTPGAAIQITGMGFRIANEVDSNGEWDWRTFGTGDGFSADVINTGMLRCGDNYIDLINGIIHFMDGIIQSGNGKFFVNLTTGETRISSDTQYIDGDQTKTLGDYFQSIENEIGDVDTALGDLDAELRQAIADESVSEAEAAAVAKLLQRVQTEHAEAISAYNSIYGNSLLTGTPKTTLLNAKNALYGNDGSSGAYGTLVTRIQQVIACTTAAQIKTAMENYNTAYQAYQSNRDIFSAALRNAETAISNEFADNAASSAVDAQSQEFIFNKLTNNGESQGIYMAKDPADDKTKLYMNATYMKIGTITDGKGYNYWNLDTGKFNLSATNTSVGEQTLANYVQSNNSDSFASATAEQVFNKLTNNKNIQGITLTTTGDSPGLYINASYINSGTMSADRIKAGTITANAGDAKWNLNTGVLTTTQMNAGAVTASKGLLIQNSASADFKTLIKNGGLQVGSGIVDYEGNIGYVMNNQGITVTAYSSNGQYRGQIICPNQLDIQTKTMTVMNTGTGTNITGTTGTRNMITNVTFSGGGLVLDYAHATYCHGISGPATAGKAN